MHHFAFITFVISGDTVTSC